MTKKTAELRNSPAVRCSDRRIVSTTQSCSLPVHGFLAVWLGSFYEYVDVKVHPVAMYKMHLSKDYFVGHIQPSALRSVACKRDVHTDRARMLKVLSV